MIDINLIRNNREIVKENIKKKFQDEKLPLVDEVYELDIKYRDVKKTCDDLRYEKNEISKELGTLMRDKKLDEAENKKARVKEINTLLDSLEKDEITLQDKIKNIMMKIPQIIDDSVPIGEDDSKNVEIERFGEPKVFDYEIPYHADIIEKLHGLDKESAGRTSGNGFY